MILIVDILIKKVAISTTSKGTQLKIKTTYKLILKTLKVTGHYQQM